MANVSGVCSELSVSLRVVSILEESSILSIQDHPILEVLPTDRRSAVASGLSLQESVIHLILT